MQNNVKNNQVTAIHLMVGILLLTLGYLTVLVPENIKTTKYLFLNIYGTIILSIGIALIVLSIFFNKKIIQSKYNFVLRIIEMISLLTICIYSFSQKWYLPGAYSLTAIMAVVFAFIWEKNAQHDIDILIKDKNVEIPKFLKRKIIPWKEIKNVVLNHGILTIDCRNNKLYQFPIKEIKIPNQEKIQSFCREKIAKHEHEYNKDW